MAHLVVGHVLSGEDSQHAGQLQGLGGVNVQHLCSGILGADGGGVNHTLHLDVVAVGAAAQHLAPHVGAEGPVTHAINVALLQLGVDLLFSPEDGGGEGNTLNDLLVAGAPADVAPDGLLDVGLGGIGVLVDEGLARHHHAGDTEAALDGAHLAEGVHKGLLLNLGQALYGEDGLTHRLLGGEDTGLDGLAVHHDGTGAAGAFAAPVLDGIEVQIVAQIAQQRLILLGGAEDAVYGKRIAHLWFLFPMQSRPR